MVSLESTRLWFVPAIAIVFWYVSHCHSLYWSWETLILIVPCGFNMFQLCDCVLSRLTQTPMGIETRWHPVWYMIEKLHFLMLRRIEIFSSTSQVSVEIPLASGSTLCALIPSCSIQLFSFFARAEPERADDFSGTAGSKITRTTVQPSKLKMSGCGRLT
jgi:hypothetical protein